MTTNIEPSDSQQTRICGSCGVPKPLNSKHFSPRSDGKGGFRGSCRTCRANVDRFRRFRRKHVDQHAALRQLADAESEDRVMQLAEAILRRAKSVEGAAEELVRVAGLEFQRATYRGQRGMRGLARIIATAARVNLRRRQRSPTNASQDCRLSIPAT
jgi:hypothetical protein